MAAQLRVRTNGYVDSFSDLPLDVDGDVFMDVIQIGYFRARIVWMKNPGKSGGAWTENLIDAVGPTEFAFLVDLDNDGKARELLPQFTGAAGAPLTWYAFRDGKWQKRQVSTRSYGHGIGVGDVNGDKRNDILTPQGWLEAPADPRAPGDWTFHPTNWQQHPISLPPASTTPSTTIPPAMSVIIDRSRRFTDRSTRYGWRWRHGRRQQRQVGPLSGGEQGEVTTPASL
jgi:hypothetical protein